MANNLVNSEIEILVTSNEKLEAENTRLKSELHQMTESKKYYQMMYEKVRRGYVDIQRQLASTRQVH